MASIIFHCNPTLSEQWATGVYFNSMKTRKLLPAFVAAALWGMGCQCAVAADGATPREVEKWKQKVEAMVDSGPHWLESRLQMHWNTRARQEYIKGENYAGVAEGIPAEAPTVHLSGARSHATNYARPSIAELPPYGSDDPRGMYLANNTLPGKPKEWAPIGATGCIINSINNEIGGLAKTAALLWQATGEEKYAQAAANVFDTYMTGIYWKEMPHDLENGHQQTLVGLQSFEVIHEDALDQMAAIYPVLRPYLEKNFPGKSTIYDAAFKKWADVIEANGVPHNNWNFMQARYILKVALLLQPDEAYADGKGRRHYIDRVLHYSSIRQWSVPKLAAYGYDPATGVWAECAGYSMVVLNDFTDIADIVGRELGIDLVEQIPVIAKAAEAYPQYMMPDALTIGFGDTHPSRVNPRIYQRLIDNAVRFGKPQQEARFRRMLAAVQADSLLPYVTPTFHAPNASWLVQRTGMDPQRSLMIALNGSEGNHMHANGISMELYGHGLRLAPDGGIGLTLYSGLDYKEYYSQFPAHNTVCVDGISSYPVMKSNHPFRVDGLFPAASTPEYTPVSVSNIYFLEPESQADQRRINAIVETSDSTGYYVDIFRSRRQNGRDKFHDYFYHNMGQHMTLANATDGTQLQLSPSQQLAFAGAHLGAYSYIYNQQEAVTPADIRALYTVDMPDSSRVEMNMWMQGAPDRTVFSALSPMTEGLSRIPGMPYDIKAQPTLTFVARQNGEAWNRPFVAVFEPTRTASPSRIVSVSYPEVKADAEGSHVAIDVALTDGTHDLILSSDNPDATVSIPGISAKGSFVLASAGKWLLTGGTSLVTPQISVTTATPADVLVTLRPDGTYAYRATAPATITIGKKRHKLPAADTLTPIAR